MSCDDCSFAAGRGPGQCDSRTTGEAWAGERKSRLLTALVCCPEMRQLSKDPGRLCPPPARTGKSFGGGPEGAIINHRGVYVASGLDRDTADSSLGRTPSRRADASTGHNARAHGLLRDLP